MLWTIHAQQSCCGRLVVMCIYLARNIYIVRQVLGEQLICEIDDPALAP